MTTTQIIALIYLIIGVIFVTYSWTSTNVGEPDELTWKMINSSPFWSAVREIPSQYVRYLIIVTCYPGLFYTVIKYFINNWDEVSEHLNLKD